MEKKAKNPPSLLIYYLGVLLPFCCQVSCAKMLDESAVKSAVYLSPEFVLKPGSVENRLYYNIQFPKGHVGIKSFNGEVVDETGSPVPLIETYIYHWAVFRYYYHISNNSDVILVRNSGVCPDDLLGQYFGMASETRKTKTYVPDPYAIEVGNPAQVPAGYQEGWILNVHALDARGVSDRVGCRECRCKLYNVTKDESGKPLSPGYEGGFHCCYNQTQCEMKKGVSDSLRKLYFRYTVKWVDWDHNSVLPVRQYIFDVTDTVKSSEDSNGPTAKHNCKIEYEVKPCVSSTDACIDTRRTSITTPKGGYVVYSVGLQYPGGTGTGVYRKDGRVVCASIPIYGKGTKVGNEAGYIVGMSTCYPQPGSVEIADGETLVIESNYSSSHKHTGAAGFVKIMIADQLPKRNFRAYPLELDATYVDGFVN